MGRKVIIAGTRTYNDYDFLKCTVDKIIKECNVGCVDDCSLPELVCGMARGADSLGFKYAKSRGWKIWEFPADWNKHGKSAGYIRNKEMAEFSTYDILIAFWDGKSKGTKNMIEEAKKTKMEVFVFVNNKPLTTF